MREEGRREGGREGGREGRKIVPANASCPARGNAIPLACSNQGTKRRRACTLDHLPRRCHRTGRAEGGREGGREGRREGGQERKERRGFKTWSSVYSLLPSS